MADLILYDDSGHATAAVTDYDLDLAYGVGDNSTNSAEGNGENDFTLSIHHGVMPDRGWSFAIDGTPYGGVVDSLTDELKNGTSNLTWKGRSWQGVLASRVLQPDKGQDHGAHATGRPRRP